MLVAGKTTSSWWLEETVILCIVHLIIYVILRGITIIIYDLIE